MHRKLDELINEVWGFYSELGYVPYVKDWEKKDGCWYYKNEYEDTNSFTSYRKKTLFGIFLYMLNNKNYD